MEETDIFALLNRRIWKAEIGAVVDWAGKSKSNRETIFDFAMSGADLSQRNALWCLTHLSRTHTEWLQTKQRALIDRLLGETRTDCRRMLLQLLREQSFEKKSLPTDLLDFCLAKINSECEPYAIRAFSLYCSFKLCRHYPELIAELEQYLQLLELQPLSPGLKSALRTTRRNIARLMRR